MGEQVNRDPRKRAGMRLDWLRFWRIGAGALIAAVYIGTGDISVATSMGAKFGFQLWWTYFILAVAAFAIVDMAVRYFLATGKTPMSIFKDVHPFFSAYLFITIVVCTIFGAYSQWNACAMALTGIFPEVPLELGGALMALIAFSFLVIGSYSRMEKIFLILLLFFVVCFFGSAIILQPDAGDTLRGLIPNIPGEGWASLFQSNAGSMINAWLILIYPYAMMEKGLFSSHPRRKYAILRESRIDYGWGILAAAIVAFPIMAAAAEVAKPFGIVPRSYMDLSVLLEPLAGPGCALLFLLGLWAAAFTSGVGWWVGGSYALLDVFNLPIRLQSKPMRVALFLFLIPSIGLLFLRINPVYQILVFAAFLSIVFPVIGLVLVYRVTRPDMGQFRWSAASWRGIVLIAMDIFAVLICLYIGWARIGAILGIE